MNHSFVIVNTANFLGTTLVKAILEAYPSASIAIVDAEGKDPQLANLTNHPNISIFNYSLYFSQLTLPQGATVIYNGIYEEGTHAEMLDISINYKTLLTKVLETNSTCILLTTLNKPSKKIIEDHIYSLHTLTLEFAKTGLHGKVIALGDIYGPGMMLDEAMPLSHLLTSALHAKSITVEKGSEFRYYIYIEDAIEGILHAFSLKEGGTFTLADPFDVSNYSLAIRLGEITGKKILRLDNERPDDHLKTLPHILPQWKPIHTLEQGLEETLSYFKIQTAAPVPIQQISSPQQDTKPIRNYTPNVSVFRDIPDDPIEARSVYDIHKGSQNIKSIADIREYADKQEIKKSRIPITQRMQHIGGAKQPSHNTTGQKVLTTGVGAIILLCLYLFIGLPVIKTVNAYQQIQGEVNGYTIDKNIHLEKSIHTFSESFSALQWLFAITHQQTRYNNFINSINALQSFTAAQATYMTYTQPLNTALHSIPKQDASTSLALNKLVNSTNTGSDTHTAIAIALQALDGYTPYFPGNQTHIKSILKQEDAKLPQISLQTTILPALLSGNKKFIGIVYQNVSHSPYTDTGITLLSQININNGIYNGLTTLPSPKHLSFPTMNDFEIGIENQYTTVFNGIIVIDTTGIQTLSALTPQTQNANPIHTVMTHLFAQDTNTLLPTIRQLIENNHIIFFLNNLNLTKDDIMKSIY